MTPQRQSLAKRLTSRLILWQVLTLSALAISVPIVDFAFGSRSLTEPDPSTSDKIAAALHVTEGELSLLPTPEWRELTAKFPGLWFVVANQSGLRFEYGDLPAEMEPLAESLPQLDVVELSGGGFRYLDALVRLEESPVGEVSILFGGGPVMGPLTNLARYAVGDVLPILVLIVLVLALTTGFVIPRLTRNSMAGLREAASHAANIDLNKPGTRLPASDVPAEIASLVDAMNAALRRIDDGYERHQRFLADAAHELRTPIAILQNRIELMAGGGVGNQLLLDIHRLANLAEQLLDLQRMNHPRSDLRPVDLVRLARQALSDLAPMAVNAGYQPHFAAEAESVPVIGDSSAIERAVINIIQNAIAYGGNRGRIVVSVLTDRKIEVSDDGEGVPPEQRDKIFEPFHRIRPIDRGAGLGLNLVREIMRHHGGTVSVSESGSGGARFVLLFPADAVQ